MNFSGSLARKDCENAIESDVVAVKGTPRCTLKLSF